MKVATGPSCRWPRCGWLPDADIWRAAASCTPTAAAKEYTSAEFRAEIRELGMRQSMGRVGSC
jgi:transposase InsO family protein